MLPPLTLDLGRRDPRKAMPQGEPDKNELRLDIYTNNAKIILGIEFCLIGGQVWARDLAFLQSPPAQGMVLSRGCGRRFSNL
jgi:hypothetical protein